MKPIAIANYDFKNLSKCGCMPTRADISERVIFVKEKAMQGRPYAGNSHVWFAKGASASEATPRRGSLLCNLKLVTIAFLAEMFVSPAIAADPPAKFRWDDVDGDGKTSYITPIKTQKSSEDQSYAYAAMDYFETINLIFSRKSYSGLSDSEKSNAVFSQAEVESYAANACDKLGAFTHNNVYQYGNKVPSLTKSLDWMLRFGLNGKRLMHLIMVEALDPTQDTGSSEWNVAIRTIKRNLLDGPLLTGYQHVDDYIKDGKYCYFPEYPVTSYRGVNYYRTAMVVGYDDSIPASCFHSEDQRPAGDGAWIVKGSYGTSFGDDGYFYISYYDDCIFRYIAPFNFYFAEYTCILWPDTERKYGDFYCHRAESPSSVLMEDMDSCAVVFTANRDGVISAIGMMGAMARSSHKIYAFVNCNSDNPATGSCVVNGDSISHPGFNAGYYTLDLPHPFEVKKGQRFSIIVDRAGGVGIMTNPKPVRGRCFRSHWNINGINAMEWTDMADKTKDNEWFITAYTENDGVPSIELTASDGLDDGIHVSWTSIEGAKYKLYRREDGGAGFAVIAETNESNYHDKSEEEKGNVKLGKKKYYYYVETTIDGEKIESQPDEGFAIEKQDIPEEVLGNGPKPPEPSDILFVVKEGGGINTPLKKGEVTIQLDIPRYFGDKEKLLKSGALSETATLTIAAYDVDSSYPENPELDSMYLIGSEGNEIPLGKLVGTDKENGEYTFTISTKDLDLAASPGEVGRNIIKIKVDENDGGWVTQISWISLEIPAAPPVVIAHGIRNDESDMVQLKNAIMGFGLPVYTFSFHNNGNDGIRAGAKQLGDEIEQAKKDFIVEHVNIVAHSMGGLKAREYAENANDVAKVLQIATPNAGAPFADLMIAIRLLVLNSDVDDGSIQTLDDWGYEIMKMRLTDDALRDLSVAHMNQYNRTARLNDDVYYRVIAGSVIGGFGRSNLDYWLAGGISYNHGEGDDELKGDGIVPLISAHTFISPYNNSPIETDENGASHSALVVGNVNSVIMELKEDLISKKTTEYLNAPQLMIASRQNRIIAEYESVLHKLSNELQSGEYKWGMINERQEIRFNVVNQNDLKLVLDIGNCSACAISFVSPSGTEMEGGSFLPGGRNKSAISVENSGGHVEAKISSPEIGTWTMCVNVPSNIQNGKGLPYLFHIYDRDDGLKMNVWLENDIVNVGDGFIINAKSTFNGVNVLGNVEAKMLSKSSYDSNEPCVVPLVHIGDGLYRGSLPTPTVGEYDIAVTVEAVSPLTLIRSRLLSGVVYESRSKFTNTTIAAAVDMNGNGIYDNLTVDINVDVTTGGTYRVLATLSDSNGNEVTEAWTSNIVCAAGVNSFPVAFSGRDIYEHGECDGYVVSSVKLIEVGESYEAVVDERKDFFTTTDYNFRQFEHALVEMGANGSENAVDEDGDGVYDRLDVEFPVHIDKLIAGEYKWNASLEDDSGRHLEMAFGDVTFMADTEDTLIPMSFNGKGIAENMNTNGQFHVSKLVIWGNGRTFRFSEKFTTQCYELGQWGVKWQNGMRFVKSELSVDEGGNVVVRVDGGNADKSSSVKVYLTYNTAAAADVDLKTGAVNGETPKIGLKFPLTLKWEAGEIGEMEIAIPVKADKAVEDDEFFTLQLADAQGMELGEGRVCTVTIHDPGYDDLAEKVAAGTATKAEKSTWDKLQKAKAPYIRGVADSAERGKVTGSGLCAEGKKVTLKATANKGFVFLGWTAEQIPLGGDRLEIGAQEYVATTPSLVIDRTANPAKGTATSTAVTDVDGDATYYANFVTSGEDKASVALALDGAELRRAEDNAPFQTNVFAGVYLEWPVAASALSATAVKVTGLPSGLKFAAKPVTGKVGSGKSAVVVTNVPANTIYGAPTAASKADRHGVVKPSDVKVTVTTAGKSSVVYLAKLTVDPLPAWAVGSFEGPAGDGVATMGVTASGKVSGKFSLGGTNWTFKADSYSAASGKVGTTNFVVSAAAAAGKATLPVELSLSSLPLDYLPASATACAEGSFGGADAALYRLVWSDKGDADAASLAAFYAGAYSFVAAYGDTTGGVALALSEKGAAKGTAVLPDGAKTRKPAFSANALPEEDGLHLVVAIPADAKKGYPAVFEDRLLVPNSGAPDDIHAYRDPAR